MCYRVLIYLFHHYSHVVIIFKYETTWVKVWLNWHSKLMWDLVQLTFNNIAKTGCVLHTDRSNVACTKLKVCPVGAWMHAWQSSVEQSIECILFHILGPGRGAWAEDSFFDAVNPTHTHSQTPTILYCAHVDYPCSTKPERAAC